MMKLFQNNTPSNQPLPQGSVPPPPNSTVVASSTLARSPTCYFLAISLLTPRFFIFLTTRSAQVLAKNTPIQHLLHPLEGFAARNGMLAASVDPVGGMVWVHARCTSHNCLHVSTQHIVCNNQALINHYSSPEAFDAACQSYGGLTDDPMLKPNE